MHLIEGTFVLMTLTHLATAQESTPLHLSTRQESTIDMSFLCVVFPLILWVLLIRKIVHVFIPVIVIVVIY